LDPPILSPNWFINEKFLVDFHCGKNCIDDLHLNDMTNANYTYYIKVEVILAKNIKRNGLEKWNILKS
jgi:hypothetical protein